MDTVQCIEFNIKFGSEPDEGPVPAIFVGVGLPPGQLNGVVPSPLPRRFLGPLGTGWGVDGRVRDFRWNGTLRSHVSE